MNNSKLARVKVISVDGRFNNDIDIILEKNINEFIETDVTELIDIKYSICTVGQAERKPYYSAIIIYK